MAMAALLAGCSSLRPAPADLGDLLPTPLLLVGELHDAPEHQALQRDTVQQLARLACMSKPHFFRSFKRELGISPLDFVVQGRLRMARSLLLNPALSISDVCYRSGFNNLAYFAQQFKKTEGITPTAFRTKQIAGAQM